ncbi:hypothetical protein niasHT_003639 [Heterodera trifolii]|uniref:Uncharacterized protein n=1 Tax=Heterodera trifolii TaxID=157864 RepID=A0ABD2MFL6_9BILA
MDLILATDWMNNAYPEMEQDKPNMSPKEDPSWISLIDEEEKREPFAIVQIDEEEEKQRKNPPENCDCGEKRRCFIPLVDHLCKKFECSAHELHVLFKDLGKRRAIVEHLRFSQLRTSHLRPSIRNFPVRCNDLSILDAHSVPAYRGYLGITMFSVSNCTVVFKINAQPLTLEQFLTIAQHGANTEYNPRRFHAIIMRIRSSNKKTVAALIFQSARVVLTGVPHPDRARVFAKRVLRRIQHTQNHIFDIHEMRVVNIVGVKTFPQRIYVERLVTRLGGVYDPSIFPALRCKLENEATCLIYISGKIIITGVSSIDNLHNLFQYLSSVIPQFFR